MILKYILEIVVRLIVSPVMRSHVDICLANFTFEFDMRRCVENFTSINDMTKIMYIK